MRRRRSRAAALERARPEQAAGLQFQVRRPRVHIQSKPHRWDGFYEFTDPIEKGKKRKDKWLFMKTGEPIFAIAGHLKVNRLAAPLPSRDDGHPAAELDQIIQLGASKFQNDIIQRLASVRVSKADILEGDGIDGWQDRAAFVGDHRRSEDGTDVIDGNRCPAHDHGGEYNLV